MKVQPINQTNFKQPVFQGLWGKPEHYVYSSEKDVATLIKHHYYSFKDEPLKEVRRNAASRTLRNALDWTDSNGMSAYRDISVEVHELPFTENEYINYLEKTQFEQKDWDSCRKIEKFLKRNVLVRYLNKGVRFRCSLDKYAASIRYPNSKIKQILYSLKSKIII